MSIDGAAERTDAGGSLLDALLAEQQRLQTPVARFAEKGGGFGADSDRPSVYADLIPLTAPGAGEQYAFEVDLDSCTGCKACVAACHSLNGLDENETWRDIGLLVSPDAEHPFTQTVTTACHHCADPGCLNGCPVLAYEKDPATGIVQHLADQCIGCGYCVLKCPYDVPKYNPARGIVRKCDMCHGRLSAGEAPACVQACPTQAIRIVTVLTTRGADGLRADTSGFLPGAPDPSYTQPTTRYVTRRGLAPNLAAADARSLRPEPPHWPLVILLTLVPMAVGCFAAAALWPLAAQGKVAHDATSPGRLSEALSAPGGLIALGWLAGAAGLLASVLHLGRPWRAWRIFLGFRRSWLSREAVALGFWFALATVCALRRFGLAGFRPAVPAGAEPLTAFAALCGMGGLFCCVMVYADTRREFWRWTRTAPRFLGTALVLGLGGALAIRFGPALGLACALATLLKLAWERRAARIEGDVGAVPTPARRTANLLNGPLRPVNRLRIIFGLAGGVMVPGAIAAGAAPVRAAWLGLGLMLIGETAERYLFFRAVAAPKMPGLSLDPS
jgi:Fe-S-cluster-containing dehydrogenase component/DMSO reductase anchor subunit